MKQEEFSANHSSERIREFSTNPSFGNLIAGPDRAWLSLHSETAIEPDLPIVDAHHHLWDLPRKPYLADEILADLGSGHRVTGTVFVQCSEGYLQDGPPELRPVGETQFVRAVSEECAARGSPSVCAGIVGYVDLRRGAVVDLALDAHIAAARGRFRGIRQAAVFDKSGELRATVALPPEGLLLDPTFREGFTRLAERGLSFDAWVYHHQLSEVADLARSFPRARIIIDHTGGPIGMGPYAGQRAEVFDVWRKGVLDCARIQGVFMKLGGLGMPLGGFGFHQRPRPPTSDELAQQWRPYFETCIEAFGTERCMFESNFPVDNVSCSYPVLWNAFKKTVSGCSAHEKRQLFSETAERAYRVDILT